MYIPLLMNGSRKSIGGLCKHRSLEPESTIRGVRTRKLPAGLLLLAFTVLIIPFLISNCQPPEEVQKEKERTLTPDERYIVSLYMKINEIEKNLQDNPEERDKKLNELKNEYDPERVRAILEELEKDPERWLAVYGRINELLERND